MHSKTSTRLLIVAVCLAIAVILQATGLARYVDRLPDDWVGVGLYSAALVGFAIAAVSFFIQWQKEKKLGRQQQMEKQSK